VEKARNRHEVPRGSKSGCHVPTNSLRAASGLSEVSQPGAHRDHRPVGRHGREFLALESKRSAAVRSGRNGERHRTVSVGTLTCRQHGFSERDGQVHPEIVAFRVRKGWAATVSVSRMSPAGPFSRPGPLVFQRMCWPSRTPTGMRTSTSRASGNTIRLVLRAGFLEANGERE